MSKLEKIATELEKGELSLDESVSKFEEGMKLSKQCSDLLENAEKRITILLKDGEEIKEENFVQEPKGRAPRPRWPCRIPRRSRAWPGPRTAPAGGPRPGRRPRVASPAGSCRATRSAGTRARRLAHSRPLRNGPSRCQSGQICGPEIASLWLREPSRSTRCYRPAWSGG